MADVIVPNTPKNAFNPDRPPSGLITSQVEHLEAALGVFREPGQRRTGPRTEGEAAEYIAQLTAQLHPQPGGAVVENPVAPGVTAITRARAKSIPRRTKKRRAHPAEAEPASRSRRAPAAGQQSKATRSTAKTRRAAAAKTAKAAKSTKPSRSRQAKTATRKRTRRTRGERD
jgi:hypothetical protein